MNINEIKEAISAARPAPWKIGLPSPSGAINVGTMNGILTAQCVEKDTALLICNAPAWLAELIFKVEEMQKALEWYADPKNYRHVESAAYSDVALDEGETARDALKGVETK
jgi:hypothetical protein